MSLSEYAEIKGVKYFLISFVDLFGTMRAKIVPATAIDSVAKSGAGFAGFAAWFDMTPAHPDVLVSPDHEAVIQLPWKPEHTVKDVKKLPLNLLDALRSFEMSDMLKAAWG